MRIRIYTLMFTLLCMPVKSDKKRKRKQYRLSKFGFGSNLPCNFTILKYCSCILCSWLETNTPYYYSECVKVVGPLMEQSREKVKTAAIFISENTSQFILWVKEKTPQAIEWVRHCLNGCKTVIYN